MEIEKIINETVFDVVKKYGITKEMIKPETRIVDDLGAESLDIIEMMLAFQDKFDLSIDDENVSQVNTLEDVYKFIKENINHKKI